MKGACILCGRIAEVSKSQGKAEYSITCNTCRIYIYDHFFKGAYLSMREDERAMISAYTRECFELGNEPPKLEDPDNLKGIIAEYKSKTIEEKLNNLLFYVRIKSKFVGDSVPWAEEKDYPITYSPYPQESSKIRDLAINRNLLYWKSRDSGLELSGDGWEETEKLQKESIGTMKGKRDQFLIRLNEMSEGKIDKFIDTMSVGDVLDFDRATTFNCAKYFDQEGYIKARDDAYGEISITVNGIDEADKIQSRTAVPSFKQGNYVFIVHGHDDEAKESVARYIEKLSLEAIILHEMPNKGRAIMEKLEDHSDVGFAVVILTPDDLGTSKDKREDLKPRARQNVIFELGYFVGKLRRERICVLRKENVEIPSDYEGILYIEMDKGGGWKQRLAKEMKEVGIKIDPIKLL